MPHGDAREGKWRGNWLMEWVASILHTTSEHGVSSITTADAHTSAVPVVDWTDAPTGRFKWTRPFRPKDEKCFLRVCHHISNATYMFANARTHVFCWTTALFSIQNYSLYCLRILWPSRHNEALVSLMPLLMFVSCYLSVDHYSKLSLSDNSATRPSN
jgi:hypothetical protein